MVFDALTAMSTSKHQLRLHEVANRQHPHGAIPLQDQWQDAHGKTRLTGACASWLHLSHTIDANNTKKSPDEHEHAHDLRLLTRSSTT
jgi:hypothetical protein